jgi:Na+:H+ antiporter, NhaA family
LLALAIIDDLGAIIIIAVFHTAELSLVALALAGLGVAVLVALNLSGVALRAAYMLIGVSIWVGVLKSGIHATLAGVIVGVAMPLNAADGSSPARDLEHALHPWIAFGVLPAFAFANAGLSLTDIGLSDLLHPIQLGIGLGLFLGQQLAVIVSIWIATRAGLATLPEGTDWRHIWSRAIDRHRLHNESVYGHARLSGRGL